MRRAWHSVWQSIVPAPADDAGPAAALCRITGGGWTGYALAALIALLALVSRAWDWLGLFCLMLAPPLLADLFGHTSLAQRLGWRGTWLALLSMVAALGWAAGPLHQAWSSKLGGISFLHPLQLFAAVAGFGALTLALPLWHVQSQGRALRLARLERAALEAELKALQAQIEPHFLYNTLANTRYLVRNDSDKAVQMLTHLIGYLRSALPDMRSQGSTLKRECELAEHYLSIMAIRFGSRLSYRIDCPADLQDASLPPLMLMSLVENAVQHGVEPTPGTVEVTLSAHAEHDGLHLLVRDNGAASEPQECGSGVGLRNLHARLAARYGDRASFALRLAPGSAEAELIIPLELCVCTPAS